MKPRKMSTFRIKDLGKVVTGRTPATAHPEYFGDDFLFVTPSDMDGRKTISSTTRGVSFIGSKVLGNCRVPVSSVAVSCIGWQMGKPAIIGKPGYTNQQINTVIPNDLVDSSYLFYKFSTMREYFQLLASVGTRTPILKKSAFENIEIELPPLDVQRRIAGILSAYDDLIENNTRRIKLLEQAAHDLYREWFVEFRFPGRESVELVDSGTEFGAIPRGWEARPIASLGKVITGKTPSKANPDNFGDFVPFIKLPDMHNQIFALKTEDGLSELGAQSQAGKTVPADTLCVSCIGTVGKIVITATHAQTNQQINSVVLRDPRLREFTYFALLGMRSLMENYASTGATMANLSKGKFENLTLVLPEASVLEDFHNYTGPSFDQIRNLETRDLILRETRDLLLPRLVSGELDVSDLDIQTGAES